MTGIYLHIPFCEKKCVYCDFYSIESLRHMSSFVDSLCREIVLRRQKLDRDGLACEPAASVFFGGGTPSLLSPEQMGRILGTLRDNFDILPDAEWTMECNPGTVTPESLSGYRRLGINRLSFGVQSFIPAELEFLHRIHSPDEARDAIRLAREAGFDNVNLDLMFALPPQDIESWKYSLEEGLKLGPDHISAYSLIFEEGTPLYTSLLKGRVAPKEEDEDAAMYDYAIERLAEAGFTQYEVSNFAREGRECRHNLIYWSGSDYLAFGPSAHGYFHGERYWNARSVQRYGELITAETLPVTNSEVLSPEEKIFERAFLELRAQGIRTEEFRRDFGIDLMRSLAAQLDGWEKEGLVTLRGDRLALTAKGYPLCDAITLEIIALLEKALGVRWEEKSPPAGQQNELFALPVVQ